MIEDLKEAQEYIQDTSLFRESFKKLNWYDMKQVAECFVLAYEDLSFVKERINNGKLERLLNFDQDLINEVKVYLTRFDNNKNLYNRKLMAIIEKLGDRKVRELILTYSILTKEEDTFKNSPEIESQYF